MNVSWIKFVLFFCGAALSEHWLPLSIMIVMAVYSLESAIVESKS